MTKHVDDLRVSEGTAVSIWEVKLFKMKPSKVPQIDLCQCKIYEKILIMNILFSQAPNIPLHSQSHLHLSDSLANVLPPPPIINEYSDFKAFKNAFLCSCKFLHK